VQACGSTDATRRGHSIIKPELYDSLRVRSIREKQPNVVLPAGVAERGDLGAIQSHMFPRWCPWTARARILGEHTRSIVCILRRALATIEFSVCALRSPGWYDRELELPPGL